MHVHAERVTVRHGAVLALDDVSLDVKPGSRLVLWGGAGSGKTTLLKVLAGLVAPSSGTAHWDSHDIATLELSEKRRQQARVGMVFQTDALFDSMSVLENVRFPLLRRGVEAGDATRRAEKVLAMVGLQEAASKRPEALSGGMKKRTGIARAIVTSPEVLLADDPFAGLDPVTEAAIAAVLLSVSEGKTLIAALPDPLEVLPVERALHVQAGRVSA